MKYIKEVGDGDMWFLSSKEKLKVKALLPKIDDQSQLKWQPVTGKGKTEISK